MRRAGAAGAFASVTCLFFAWGFISANNDPLIAALRGVFRLGYTEALLTQIMFFLAFGLVSLPAAVLVQRIGAVRAIVAALGCVIAGCMVVQASHLAADYAVILAGLFVIAAGIATLQVAANPLAALMGPPERSHFRLTLAQSFNSLGVVCGVHFGAALMLGGEAPATLAEVQLAYLLIALLAAVLILMVWTMRAPVSAAAASLAGSVPGRISDALRSRWALGGAAAIAVYVGAEVSIGSVMINFLADPDRLGVSLAEAGFLLATFYWGGALVGRLLGAMMMRRIAAARLLLAAALAAAGLCAIVLGGSGVAAGVAALAVGLFNSIMFPAIFALTLERSEAPAPAVSGLLCVAIIGGAIVPLLVGAIADHAGLTPAFAVPFIAYLAVALFAFLCLRLPPRVAHPGLGRNN